MILEIAHAIHPGRRGQRHLFVFTYKFDESYKGAQTMVVGGWIGNEKQWVRVQRRWCKAIAYENRSLPGGRKITRYHAAEMNANDGEYKGWENEGYRKLRFTRKLLKICGRSEMIPIACGMDLKAFLDSFPNRKPPDYGIAYGLCVKVLMSELGHAVENYPNEIRIALVHDHGDWDVLAHDGFYQWKDSPDWKLGERFVSITALSSYDDIGLQCSDLFAYEAMRYLHDHGWEGKDMRAPLRTLFEITDADVFGVYLNRKYLESLKEVIEQGTLNGKRISEIRSRNAATAQGSPQQTERGIGERESAKATKAKG